jgi:hypothetical protein
MSKVFCFIAVLLNLTLAAQQRDFHLEYETIGLGSNYGHKTYPRFQIEGNLMHYTVSDNYWRKGEGIGKSDSVFVYGEKTYQIELRWSSVDSIEQLINSLSDTLISRWNPFIMSGAIHILKAKAGEKEVKFEMHNTFDRTALIITDIINQYVSAEDRTNATLKDILDAEEFWHSLEFGSEEPDSLKNKK